MARPILIIEPSNGGLDVRFDYNIEIVKAIKGIGGGRWDANLKVWHFPLSKAEALESLNAKLTLEYLSQQSRKAITPSSISSNSTSTKSTSTHRNDHWIQQLREHLVLKGYSPKTIKSYCSHLGQFLNYSDGLCDLQTIKSYLLEQLEERNCSHTHANQVVNAIKQHLIQRGEIDHVHEISIPRPKREHKLPKVMSKQEVQSIISCISNLKHQTAIMLAYSCGLRVSEVVHLKLADIDYSRNVILIRQSKGRVDRVVPLSKRFKEKLGQYLAQYRPHTYLFENQDTGAPITDRTIQTVFNNAVRKVGIKKPVTFHSLRHSYATHLLETGVDLRYIQELLGHKHSKTTEIYTHVTNKSLQKIINPLDQLDV